MFHSLANQEFHHLRFNENNVQRMKEVRDTNEVRDFTKTTAGTLVSFHVRRGDKILSKNS